jgi:two-component system alkaline phosphatase synthesis response regulator PhoP
MSRVLVVEDDKDIAALIVRYLTKAGYAAETLDAGTHVLPRVRQDPPELLILDLMLPGVSGLQICSALRAEPTTAAMPIIMLTARGEEADRILGLELGADDYLTKPFSPNELIARVRALLRRAAPRPAPQAVLRYGPIVLNAGEHTVSSANKEVRLTAKEFLLLQYLMQRPGRVVTRDLLLSDVWGYDYPGETRTVDVHVRRLREKVPYLGQALVTVQQFGYKLVDPAPEGAPVDTRT